MNEGSFFLLFGKHSPSTEFFYNPAFFGNFKKSYQLSFKRVDGARNIDCF